VVAAWLRLTHLWGDLPANSDPDEPYYFLWAQAVRETGYPNVENGTGYPPGLLYLLAGEQLIVNILQGQRVTASVDYFVIARAVNGLLGVVCVSLMALLGKQVGKSRLVGAASAIITAGWPLLVNESRRGGASAPWVLFTLATFVLLNRTHHRENILLLYAALATGVASFLFKYQTITLLPLPFAYATIYFRSNLRRLASHTAVWSIGLALIFYWLVFDYRILEVVNTPNSPTRTIAQDGRIIGFQSLDVNWAIITKAPDQGWYLWGALIAAILAGVSVAYRASRIWIDSRSVACILTFGTSYFLLMSLFAPYPRFVLYWLPVIATFHALAPAGLYGSLRLLGSAIAYFGIGRLTRIAQLIPLIVLVATCATVIVEQWKSWDWTYHHIWAKPYTVNLLNSWFSSNVPQGGRVVSEANKILLQYVYAPDIVHVNVVDSIFNESVEDYRRRGYEYLIWNSMRSHSTDSIVELDARLDELTNQGAREALRLNGANYTGPAIVVFTIDPLPTNEIYVWFTPAISFRGYDLNADTFKPGDELQLMLYWESAEKTEANYIVFAHVLDSKTGKLLVGKDGPPDYGNTPTPKWQGDMQFIRDQRILTIPADAAPGAYTLRIGMYEAATQSRVQILDLNYQPTGDVLVLQEITVEK